MNDLTINGINVNKNKTEELYSSIIAAILNYSNQNYSVFKSFLKLADSVSGNRFPVFSNLPVNTPTIEAEKYEIDVLINDNDYRIIIENKINNASDGHSQLARYIDGSVNGAHYLEKDVYIIYITDGKKDPNNQSWIRLDNRLIATDYRDDFKNRFVSITRKNICDWLEKDVNDLCFNEPEMRRFINISLKLFKKEINENDFKNNVINNNVDNINYKEIPANWEKTIKSRYSQDLITDIEIKDKCIDIIFQWESKEHKIYKLGCLMELYPKTEDYEKTFFRYGIHKVDEDIPYFSNEFLTNLFELFFKTDRYYDRYNHNFNYRNEYNAYYFYASREVQLWSCSDYKFQFVLEYYLLDLIDKIIMFIIAPSQLGLLNLGN